MERIAGYILAGGNNRRMQGRKKLFLPYDNQTDFFHSIMQSMKKFPKVYLSVAKEEKEFKKLGLPLVADRYVDAGPLGGILSGLLSCEEEGLFVVPCDIPVIEEKFIDEMLHLYDGQTPVIVKQDGCCYPMPGIYTKSQIPVMKEMMARKDYKLMNVFQKNPEGQLLHTALNTSGFQTVRSINTREEYERWRKGHETTER